MSRKLDLAASIIVAPGLLFLDEPTAGTGIGVSAFALGQPSLDEGFFTLTGGQAEAAQLEKAQSASGETEVDDRGRGSSARSSRCFTS